MSLRTGSELFEGSSDAAERRLNLLYEAGRRLSRSLDPNTLFAALIELVKEVMSCDGLLVSAYSPHDDMIRCEYAWVSGMVHDPNSLPPLPLNRDGTGMQSQVILERRPRMFDVVEKVRERPDGQYSEMGTDGNLDPIEERDPLTKSALMCPMLMDGDVMGVVQVMSDSRGAYTAEDLELIEALVHQLTPAVQNSRLYSRLKHELQERQAAEQALEHSERRFKTLVDSMPIIAWATEPRTRSAEYINQHFYDYTGIESVSHTWELVVHPEDRGLGRERLEEAIAAGGTWEQELRLRRRDGAYRWHLSRMVPVRDSSGTIVLWLGTSTDIHQQKEAEASLEERVAERTMELQAAVRELEGFTYSVSHDLRAPLRSIIATSVVVQQEFAEELPPEAGEMLQRQANSAKKMAILIDDLLHLSRLSRLEMSRSRVDLSSLAAEVFEELREEGRYGMIELVISPDVVAHADPRLIRLVLLNLLQNGAKFSPHGGRIWFGSEGGRYFVRDEGIGFDMAYVDRLFRPFERLVREDEFEGTGIGLANVKRIVERHGGLAWARSELGKGATFSFTLG